MSKESEINLVEAISLLEEMRDNALIACRCYKTGGVLYRDEKAEKKVEAIETVLKALENSISKDKIKEKIEELANTKGDFATYIATSERIKVLQELLEEK